MHASVEKHTLLRSEEKLNREVSRLLQLCGVKAEFIFPVLEIKQQFFLIDRSLYQERPDLLHTGRTLFGSLHSFPVKNRILAFLRELGNKALPLKITYQEIASPQWEVTVPWERGVLAVEQNVQLMKLMQQVALQHDLVCLFHEKPFLERKGSGKPISWSLETDTGLNLLQPQENSLVFSALVTAITRAIQEHAGLLQGDGVYVHAMAAVAFRDVEVSRDCAFLLSAINAIVADSLQLILDEIADVVKDRKLKGEALWKAALPVLHKTLPTEDTRKSFPAFAHLIEKKTVRVFETILSEEELHNLYESWIEKYAKTIENEANWMRKLFQTQILPATQKQMAPLLDEAILACEAIKERQEQMADLGWEAKAKVSCELLIPQMENLRKKVDALG